MDLTVLAKKLYFNYVRNEDYRSNFVEELKKRVVLDKRDEGYHCTYCTKIQSQSIAFVEKDKVIFPRGNNRELWIVNSHYDGCRGWN